jgi:hypothetical protein
MWPKSEKKRQRPSWPKLLATTNQEAASSDYFDTTSYCWDRIGDPKKLFVLLVLEEIVSSNCLARCIDSL